VRKLAEGARKFFERRSKNGTKKKKWNKFVYSMIGHAGNKFAFAAINEGVCPGTRCPDTQARSGTPSSRGRRSLAP
jgi:hypothetical protein